ncbi:MAG: ABC transporter substrate-binding protein [Bacillota bacterium]
MRSKPVLTIFMLFLLAILVTVVACGKKDATTGQQEQTTDKDVQKAAKTLILGNATPMSGGASMWGVAISKDMDIYAELINEDGGIKVGEDTYKLEMHYADDEALAEKATVATEDLINNLHVQAILGYWSGGTNVVSQVALPTKTILISTKPDHYDAKTMPYTAFSANDGGMTVPQLSSLLKHWPETKVIGIVTDEISTNMLQTVMPEVEAFLKSKGVSYVYVTFPWDAKDLTTQLEKLKQAHADVIYFWSAIGTQALMNKQMYEGNYNMHMVGAGALVAPKDYVDVAGYDAAQGILQAYTPPWDLKETKVTDAMKDMSQRIMKRHAEKYDDPGYSADGVFNYGGNSMALYLEAIQKAGTLDPDAVMKVIDGGTFDLFTGTQTMGGLKTFGRAVVAGVPGSLGEIQGYAPKLVAESPRVFE